MSKLKARQSKKDGVYEEGEYPADDAPLDDSAVMLPIKQRLYMKYRPLLSGLSARFTNISYSIDDASLATNLHFVLEKAGFTMRSRPNLRALNLTQYLAHWLKRGHLILLHYRPKLTDYNLIDLLKEIRAIEPALSLAGLLPIFVSPASSKKQLEVFRMLSGFGVRFAMFLTPNASLEKNLDEALQSLASYHEALERDFFVEEKEPKGVSARETSKIEEYAYLVQTGEELMRKGRLEDAINVFTEAIAIKPNFKALINRGDAYYKLRKVVAALNDYREAQKMLDTAPDPYAKISACCFTLAREAARSEDSGKARRWAEVGMKHINDAVGVIKKVQREAKNIPGMTAPATPYGPVLFALTEADFREMGLEDEWKRITELASRVIEETRDINADNQDVEIEARIDRAIILARNRHYEEAEKIFRDVTEKDPGSAGPAFNNFAVELRKNGEFGKAFEIYQELLKFRIPDREIVVENMVTAGLRYGATLRMAGRGEVATSVYLSVLGQRVREKTRQSVLCELAATCLETGAPAEASSRLMEAVYLNPALMKEPGFAARYPRLVELSAEMKDKLDEAAGKR